MLTTRAPKRAGRMIEEASQNSPAWLHGIRVKFFRAILSSRPIRPVEPRPVRLVGDQATTIEGDFQLPAGPTRSPLVEASVAESMRMA